MFFSALQGTIKTEVVTQCLNELFSWEHPEMCLGVPKVHCGPNEVKFWGGCQVTKIFNWTNIFQTGTGVSLIGVGKFYIVSNNRNIHFFFVGEEGVN